MGNGEKWIHHLRSRYDSAKDRGGLTPYEMGDSADEGVIGAAKTSRKLKWTMRA
jgi:hypothetical protein